MSLNLDDDQEFWKWYQNQTEFNFSNPQYLLDLYLVII